MAKIAVAADILSTLGEVKRNEGNSEQAVALFKRALEVREGVSGHSASDDVYTLNNLGLAYVDLAQYKDAIGAYQRALQISERTYGADTPKSDIVRKNLIEANKLAAKDGSAK
jgi:tetratricopeptide (TPR) repeat protein